MALALAMLWFRSFVMEIWITPSLVMVPPMSADSQSLIAKKLRSGQFACNPASQAAPQKVYKVLFGTMFHAL
jgi:hypothetical protein